MSFVSMLDSLEAQFNVPLKLGLTAAPPYLGNEDVYLDSLTQARFIAWNDTLALYRESDWLDAYIVHLYARQLRLPCIDLLDGIETDSIHTQEELIETFDCLNESIKAYYGPQSRFPGGDNIRRHIKELLEEYASRTPGRENELWITEWSWSSNERFSSTLLSNTFLDALFMQRWLHEMLAMNTAMVKNPLGLRITMLNRQLLTGTTENSLIAKRTELDRNYQPDPNEPPGSLWSLGASKAPEFLRRITYWPMQQFAYLNGLQNIPFVDVEGTDTTENMFVYACASDGIDSNSTQLDIFYTWSDSLPYLMQLGAHGIVQTSGGPKRPLSERVLGSWTMEYAEGAGRASSAGWNKYIEIAPPLASVGFVPEFDYPHWNEQSDDRDSIWLPPYSFGRLTLQILNPIDSSMLRTRSSTWQWNAFPNPVGAQVTLFIDAIASEESSHVKPTDKALSTPEPADDMPWDDQLRVQLLDATGRPMLQTQLPGAGTHQLDLHGLPTGVYTLIAENRLLAPLRILHYAE
jgi:hypothetical protein